PLVSGTVTQIADHGFHSAAHGRVELGGVDNSHCCRYQATVRARPSLNGVLALNPNSCVARVVSSDRRGWPLGLVVSHAIRPVKPQLSATSPARSRIEISKPAPMFTGSAPSYRSVAITIARAQSST